MSRRNLVTSESPLDLGNLFCRRSLPYHPNRMDTKIERLEMRYIQTINIVKKDEIEDTDYLINMVLFIPVKHISVDSYTRSIMSCFFPHLDLPRPL